MENVNWGVPTKNNRNKKTEKWNTPVITMNAVEKKGSGRKFTFNKSAREALNLVGGESHVAFGFLGDDIYVKVFEKELPATFAFNKSCGFRDVKTFNYIVKKLNLDTNIENELHFDIVDGYLKYKLASSNNDEVVEHWIADDDTTTDSEKSATVNVKGKEVTLVEPEVTTESTNEKKSAEDLDAQW